MIGTELQESKGRRETWCLKWWSSEGVRKVHLFQADCPYWGNKCRNPPLCPQHYTHLTCHLISSWLLPKGIALYFNVTEGFPRFFLCIGSVTAILFQGSVLQLLVCWRCILLGQSMCLLNGYPSRLYSSTNSCSTRFKIKSGQKWFFWWDQIKWRTEKKSDFLF